MQFSKNPGTPYTPLELFITLAAVVLLVGFPQFWLCQMPILLLIYWILLGISLVQIRLAVCTQCNNTFCPLCLKAHTSNPTERL